MVLFSLVHHLGNCCFKYFFGSFVYLYAYLSFFYLIFFFNILLMIKHMTIIWYQAHTKPASQLATTAIYSAHCLYFLYPWQILILRIIFYQLAIYQLNYCISAKYFPPILAKTFRLKHLVLFID